MNTFFKKLDQFVYDATRQGLIWNCIVAATIVVSVIPIAFLVDFTFFSNTEHTPSMAFQTHLYNNLLLYSHIAFAYPALMIGPWMFNAQFRENNLSLHRFLGKFYVVGCTYGALTVYPLAVHNVVAPVAHIGFGSMAIIWFITTYFAYMAVRNKNLAAHRRWMMRSYAMTFAFVHVNLTFKAMMDYDTMNPYTMRTMQSMVSWQMNLLIVEIYLAATTHQGKFIGMERWGKNLRKPFNSLDRFYWRVTPKAKA